ncbi:esterase/lipase-like protein [Asticcacaulis biprosthecium C19]|uniref:Esterase/lipase-like protein n=1 Tax=Asticcacaulis biprosthecium C19 TaxID=715226 RepID=F4QSY4_9CAUL|nr:alpha/beta hydrolase [Asticcacaulis biprosthecium]EGF89854.1 esterase/lipase-like protein [Asticcacaulis biprosthecium C19]
MKPLFFLLILALASTSAHAGPMRDRYLGRMKERSVGEVTDPAKILPGATVQTVAYGADAAQTLDVYAPPSPRDAPIIVMVHGGGWRLGDKASPGVVDNKLKRWLPQGFIVVSVNYRMLPDAGVDLQAQDIAHAIAYVQKEAPRWGGNGNKVIAMGHSAGAHLVALVSADPAPVVAAGGRAWRGTVVIDSAALDVTAVMQKRHPRLYDDALGNDPIFWANVSPAARLKPGAVPMLLVCSSQRPDDPCADARAFSAQLAAQGQDTQVLPQAMSHMAINRDLGLDTAYTAHVDDFIHTRLADQD